ncbi:acyl-CoA Delta-9 desaturase-like [Prorops nasuta]|uniref:acyl-CoA Delta-9 desaturase-like n=1 Tax=Prorops nasuta TaxID=863751 RepID=UPI0034CDB9C1
MTDTFEPAKVKQEFKIVKNGKMILRDNKKQKLGFFQFEQPLLWPNIIVMSVVHLGALYALTIFHTFHIYTMILLIVIHQISATGITAGPHRLWAHKSYKAKLPLKILIFLMYCTAGQSPIFHWARDHRVHHKYTDTSADPHNTQRGLFFSHVGWLLMKKDPTVIARGKQIDISDLKADPVVNIPNYIYYAVSILLFYLVPVISVYFWNESAKNAIFALFFLRYALILNVTWSVNSFAHKFGSKPYDRTICPSENFLVSLTTCGEGWHNYHHAFPWDYRATEINLMDFTSTTTLFIKFFSKIGWAYDLKQPSEDLIKTVVKNRGDGTHPRWAEVPAPKSNLD